MAEQVAHVAFEEEDISDAAEGAKRRGVVEDVGHGCDAVAVLEEMVVIEAGEGASDLGIAEAPGAFELRDAAGESLANAEVDGFPGDFLTEFDQAGGGATDGTFTGVFERGSVQIEIAGAVEAELDGSVDASFDANSWQLFFTVRWTR
jgi:hypothetical protein